MVKNADENVGNNAGKLKVIVNLNQSDQLRTSDRVGEPILNMLILYRATNAKFRTKVAYQHVIESVVRTVVEMSLC